MMSELGAKDAPDASEIQASEEPLLPLALTLSVQTDRRLPEALGKLPTFRVSRQSLPELKLLAAVLSVTP